MDTQEIISKSEHITVYRDGDYAIKAFDQSFDKSAIFREAMIFSQIEETPICIPELLGVMQLDDGRWAIKERYIEGESLLSIIMEQPEDYDEYIVKLVETQLNINDLIIQDMIPWKAVLEKQIQSLSSCGDIGGVKAFNLLTMLDGMPKHAKLCHGNLGPDNIIITPDNKTYVLDWGKAARGNGSAEAANTYLLLTFTSSVLAEKYLAIYCDYAGVSKQYVTQWIPIMAAALLSGRLKTNLQRELLLAWL